MAIFFFDLKSLGTTKGVFGFAVFSGKVFGSDSTSPLLITSGTPHVPQNFFDWSKLSLHLVLQRRLVDF
jgi:hypothetical protein